MTEYREKSTKGDRFRGNPTAKGDQIQEKRSHAKGDCIQGISAVIGAVTESGEKVRGMFAPFIKLMHHRCKPTQHL